MGVIHADVIARLDERSLRDSAGQMEREIGDAGRSSSSAFSREMSTGLGGLRGLAAEAGRGMRSGIDNELRGLGTSFDAVSSKVSGIGTAGMAAVGGIAALGVAAAVAGKALYDLGAQWDEIADGITVRTGKVGADLEALTNVVGDVGSSTAASLGSIGNIVGQISQSMPNLAENNTAVRQMASNLAFLDANGQSVNIRELGKAFEAFGVNAADQVETLDALNNVSQSTGIPINQLIETVQSGAPQFKQFGLDVGGATALIASFEDAGLNSGVAVTGLRTALKTVGDDARGAGPALADAVTQIKALYDQGQGGASLTLAQDTFGTKNAAAFADAIQSGRLSVEGLNKALTQTGLSLAEIQEATDDGVQGWQKLSNTLSTQLKPVADSIFGSLNLHALAATGQFSELAEQVGGLTSAGNAADQAMRKLQTALENAAAVPITPDSALGKMLTPGGLADQGTPGVPLPTGIGSATRPAPGSSGGILGPGGGILAPSWGSRVVSPRGGAGGGSTALPDAPAIPYDTSLPAGIAGAPQTPELYSAESSFLDARQKAAEKRARLTQLEGNTNATAEDVQNARNDVIQAERAQNEAEMRLYSTQSKRLRDQTRELGEIGAQIDSDFGISKGLAGIAENLTKFIANLAAAPLLGQLGAVSAASPSQGGYGLMGVMGAQGAFGPQYTGLTQGYGSTSGPAGLQQPGLAGGGAPSEATVKKIAEQFGLHVTSEDRPGDPGYHGRGMALDVSNGTGNTAQMRAFAEYMNQTFGGSLKELIYSDPAFSGNVKDGRPAPGTSVYDQGTLDDHQNHVHIAAQWGQAAASAFTASLSGSGMPAFSAGGDVSKQEVANTVLGQAMQRGYSPSDAQAILAYAIGESGLNPGISGGRQGGSGAADEVIGLFQQKPAFANAGGIDPSQRSDPAANTYAYLNQLERYRNLPIEQALPATSVGGPLAGGPGSAPQSWGPLMSQAERYMSGFGGGGSVLPGAGMPQSPVFGSAAPGVGARAGTRIGGLAGLSGTGKGGPGMTQGGMVDSALSMAASGLDVLAPGAGQAAQTGIKLANRAIQFGGQAVGIGVQGAIDTFLPFGGSKLASNNWATRLIGGLAGAAPALPNMAGGMQAEQVAGDPAAPQAQQPQKAGDTNINVTNNRATEDGTGRDIAYHQGQANAAPGM